MDDGLKLRAFFLSLSQLPAAPAGEDAGVPPARLPVHHGAEGDIRRAAQRDQEDCGVDEHRGDIDYHRGLRLRG